MTKAKILKSQILAQNHHPIRSEDLAYRRRMPKIISWEDHKESPFKIRWEILTHNQPKDCQTVKRNKTITTFVDNKNDIKQ